MQRRTLLKVGLVGGALLAAAGGSALWMYEPAWRDGRLQPAGERVMRAVARAVLDGSLPAEPASRDAALGAHLQRLEAAVRGMPAHTQAEVAELLAILAVAPGRRALAGLSLPWETADVAALQQALQSMRASSLLLRRQAYHALRDLTHAAFFADPSTWTLLGYPGPRRLA